MGAIEGKVALITGGTSGVGRAAAFLFAREGARVVVAGRSIDRGEAVQAEVRAAGGEALFVSADISREADVARMAAEAAAAFGTIDIAFLNAGVSSSGAMIADETAEDFSRTLTDNLVSAFLCLKHLIPHLAAPGGSVVFTSSIVSLTGSPARASYTAAKGGLNAFARAAAMELAPSGVRVNTICPAGIRSPMSEAYFDRVAHLYGGREAAAAASHALHPIGRMAEPEDVARTALFLASDAAAMITGQLLPVDGGLSAGTAKRG